MAVITAVQSRTNEEAWNSYQLAQEIYVYWETVCLTWYEFMFYRNYIVGVEDKNWIKLRTLAADCAPRSLLSPPLPAQHAGCTPHKQLVQLCFQWFKFCSPTKDSKVKQVFSKSSHSNPTDDLRLQLVIHNESLLMVGNIGTNRTGGLTRCSYFTLIDFLRWKIIEHQLSSSPSSARFFFFRFLDEPSACAKKQPHWHSLSSPSCYIHHHHCNIQPHHCN